MEHSFFCFFRGLCCTGGLFVFCFFAVLGVQKLMSDYKSLAEKPPTESVKTEEPPPKKAPQTPRKKSVKSIQINPDEFDRIYIKKV
jgi:hypothetical protein